MIGDDINAQAETLLVAALQAKYPGMDLRSGTPTYDTLIAPRLPAVADIVAQLNAAERKRSAADWTELTDEEADAAADKFFVTRAGGAKAQGSIRLKLGRRKAVALSTTNQFSKDGLIYHPETVVAKQADDLVREPVLGYFYTDVEVVAAQNGTRYDAPVGSTFAVDAHASDPDFVEAIAVSPISGGRNDETTQELATRIPQGLSVRNLVNPRSTGTVLRERFGSAIEAVLVVGMSDTEMLRDVVRIVDPVLGEIAIHLGNHMDIYVKTPITRQAVEVVVPANTSLVDLTPYRALLKIHSVQVKGAPGVLPFYSLVDQDPALRYSALDPVALFVDPALGARTLVLDVSFAPDVVAIHEFVTSSEERIVLANALVRHFVPVWIFGAIDVDGATDKINEAERLINTYLTSVSGREGIVISKVTQAIHDAGVGLVHQDYELLANVYFGDGTFVEAANDTLLRIEDNPAKGFTSRVAVYVPEGVLLAPVN